MRQAISLTTEMGDIFKIMAEGNIGCLSLLMKIVEKEEVGGFHTILILDDMNIRGQQVWIAYKYICDEDLGVFLERVLRRDKAMVDGLNEFVATKTRETERAVTHGASFTR